MTSFPGSPKVIKSGLILMDPVSGTVKRIISLQYNPDNLTRSFQIQAAGGEEGGRSQALRLKGPPVETIKLEAEIDATDQLEIDEATVRDVGIHHQLAAIETIIYPTSAQLQSNNSMASAGTLEILPMQAPLVLFVWSKERVVPVQITELSVTEEAFDPTLNPIRAKINLGLRVLSVDDLGFEHKGGSLFMNYLANKERLASLARSGSFSTLGIGGIP